jgi:hypothetical protein
MQYRRSLHIPPLRPARLAAATLRRARVTAHSRPAAGPSDTELRQWRSERYVKITLEDYDKTTYEKGKLTGWF